MPLSHLDGSFFDEMTTKAASLEDRINAVSEEISSIQADITSIESRINRQEDAIPDVVDTPEMSTTLVSGVEVPSVASVMSAISAFLSLKSSHNSFLGAARSWGWLKND